MPVSVLIRSAKHAKGEACPSLTFDGTRVVIGRGLGCEVRLPDPSVSQRHATIRAQGGDYTLLDEGSMNGTYVGDVRLNPGAPRTLRDKDLVRVGRVWLEVRLEHRPATRDLPTATRDLALKLVAEAMAAVGDDVDPRAVVVEGPDRGRTLTLAEDGRVFVVGRGESCDFLVDDVDASREHFQLVRRAGAVLVRDLGSKNGTSLGEADLGTGRDVPWRSPMTLRAGQNVFALEEPVAAALAELESAPDEAIPEGAAVSPPPAALEAKKVLEPPPEPTPEAAVNAEKAPPVRKRKAAVQPRARWSGADIAVVITAVAIIALSAAGLYWLLRP